MTVKQIKEIEDKLNVLWISWKKANDNHDSRFALHLKSKIEGIDNVLNILGYYYLFNENTLKCTVVKLNY